MTQPSRQRVVLTIAPPTHTTSRFNVLPPGFYHQRTVFFYYFTGFFTGDGNHTTEGSRVGIGLRSTELPFLMDLLKTAGVQGIKLTFTPHTSIGPGLQLNAGFFGTIRWEVGDREFAAFWETTGLPSSKVLTSNAELLQTFIPQDDHRQRNFMVWLLGFIHADGHVATRWKNTYTDPQLQLDYIQLAARDEGILVWVKQMLSTFGGHSAAILYKEEAKLYTMKLSGQMNEGLFKIGITALQEQDVTLFGKIRLLHECIQRGRLPESVIHRGLGMRQSFTDFLNVFAGNPLYAVIAQDFYYLNVYQVNELLEVFGMEPVNSIWAFNLELFVQTLEAVELGLDSTLEQVLSKSYLEHARIRMLTTKPNIKDKIYAHAFVRCDTCQHELTRENFTIHHRPDFGHQTFTNLPMVINQVPASHVIELRPPVVHYQKNDEGRYMCDRCDATFAFQSAVRNHVNNIHLKLRPHICDVCHVSFATAGSLRRHNLSRTHQANAALQEQQQQQAQQQAHQALGQEHQEQQEQQE
ncbi:uncharacterized protein BX664DRAFT_322418 [Halteromyces radiatus]|uniref:uncharacterized protein n=1 Tax=Halteromyces radiatus TaxID=101107 RepID=UPI0022202B70|nr:uncharacterized protein BX664DRAFT_322418 [Halteromyces radiatus]KAI8099924.1 hypothetical protein BX664DRAFT_322418 [Halteromyces radiatus]